MQIHTQVGTSSFLLPYIPQRYVVETPYCSQQDPAQKTTKGFVKGRIFNLVWTYYTRCYTNLLA
jgi:hypothetical protein